MKREERARQFLPFSPLKGYDELIQGQTLIRAPRRALSEEAMLELSRTLQELRRGDLVRVKYYRTHGYVTLEGMVSNVDSFQKSLQIVRTEIRFSDLFEVRKIKEG